jgi:hypothetical protein
LFRTLFGTTGPTTPNSRLLYAVIAASATASSSSSTSPASPTSSGGASGAAAAAAFSHPAYAPPTQAAWQAIPHLVGLLAPWRVWCTREVVHMKPKKEDLVVRCFLSLDAAARHFKVRRRLGGG